jgi:uncharacterized protein YpmB
MRSPPTIAALQATLLASGLCLAGQDITLDQLPAPVRATVARETTGAKINSIEQDEEQGQLIYEVEFTFNGKEYELDVSADGKLLERRLD